MPKMPSEGSGICRLRSYIRVRACAWVPRECAHLGTVKNAELDALAEAVRSENHRLYALDAQRRFVKVILS